MELVVRRDKESGALLQCGQNVFRAAVGSGGIGVKHAEGDHITPLGVFPVRALLFRADRVKLPRTRLPVSAIAPDDGWCDAPGDRAYNQPVKLPYRASAESLWRADILYDLVAILGFNDRPVVPGAGSAFFLHVARADYGATEGCIALSWDDLVAVVSALAPGDTIVVRA